jgi:vacuolar-type H+-ATPase subunit H
LDSNAKEQDGGCSRSDVLIAQAMNRVLESERTARTTIAECERKCADHLEHARQQRRAILERAQARIMTLHNRAQKSLERCITRITEQALQSARPAVEQFSDPARRRAALERLAAWLTETSSQQRHPDGH